MRNDYYSVKALTKVSFKTGDFEIENIFITSLFESRKNVSILKKFLIFFSTFFKKFISNFRFKSNLLYINFLLYKNNKAIFKLLYTYMFYIPFCRKFYVEFKFFCKKQVSANITLINYIPFCRKFNAEFKYDISFSFWVYLDPHSGFCRGMY